MNYCKDCKHRVLVLSTCGRTKVTIDDPVLGPKTDPWSIGECADERSPRGWFETWSRFERRCGPDGKFFEPKNVRLEDILEPRQPNTPEFRELSRQLCGGRVSYYDPIKAVTVPATFTITITADPTLVTPPVLERLRAEVDELVRRYENEGRRQPAPANTPSTKGDPE